MHDIRINFQTFDKMLKANHQPNPGSEIRCSGRASIPIILYGDTIRSTCMYQCLSHTRKWVIFASCLWENKSII